jgi:threonine dehydratase
MGIVDQKLLPTAADVEGAVARLKGVAVRTPLINAPVLDERLGARVFLKAEILQRTGSFKFRGAYNRLSQIPADRRGSGVVAYSSGNHAQGVAAAAKLLGMRATIVMPDDAPKAKIARTRGHGAEVVLYDRAGGEDRAAIAERIMNERGATLVPPYDDPMIIAGQGTIGVEIAEDLDKLGLKPEIVVVGASGGGLAAGVSLGIKSRAASARLFTAEPEDFDDTLRSFLRGERVANDKATGSICDALMSNTPGEWTFPINKELIGQGISASDDDVGVAVRYAFHELKLVVEPGGAIGLAALLAGKLDNVVDIRGKTVVAILSGGNVDVDMFAKLIAG